MNLELLDPFRRQIPDRVDATLAMPAYLHSRHKAEESNSGKAQQQQQDQDEWKAAYHVAYNRRGTYMAVGYASGTVGIHDVLSRTLSALYRGEEDFFHTPGAASPSTKKIQPLGNGVTSVSWSRRSRTLLAGAVGDSILRLYDNTHPYGPEECITSIVVDEAKDAEHHQKDHEKDKDEHNNPRASPSNASQSSGGDHPFVRRSSFGDGRSSNIDYAMEPQILPIETLTYISQPGNRSAPIETKTKNITRYPALHFHLPHPVGGSLEIHPRFTTGGLAVLSDGSLILFWIPESAWWEDEEIGDDDNHKGATPSVRIWTLWDDTASNIVTCASFDPQGQRVYAATKEGVLLGFEVGSIFEAITSSSPQQIPPSEKQCQFTIRIPGGAMVWHLLVSRDGKYIVINCADGALRLYSTKECWQTPEEIDRPSQVFQDVVNKVKFASCAVSGDGEYVVGGANGFSDDKYELYIWNTSTGALMDKLTGAAVQLYSVAWHPTRSFLAVATSDGLIDVWGPRINWTAFAPDFQALPMNVEYVEREDEFDLDQDGNKIDIKDEEETGMDDENSPVDVVSVEPVPVFASDSEDEEDVFHFETKFTNILGGRGGRHNLMLSGKPAYDEG
jgi:WD40 repeat protein